GLLLLHIRRVIEKVRVHSMWYAATFLLCRDIIFFFSSRRRHTRFSRDWSSDVCSSDLACTARCRPAASTFHSSGRPARRTPGNRSEERRVGKEGSPRWSETHYKTRDKLLLHMRRGIGNDRIDAHRDGCS